MQQRIAELRSKLDRLRANDKNRRVHGARRVGPHGHDYQERPVLDDEGIARLQAKYGAPLPDELVEFLRGVHGGGAGPGYGFELWGEPARAARPFPYSSEDAATLMARSRDDRYASLPLTDEGDSDDSWPPGFGFLTIAHQGCGAFDVIVVTGELRGTVWCCDMAWRPYTAGDRLAGFLDWYESWLDRNLVPHSLEKLRAP
jgi:hypothetical protein